MAFNRPTLQQLIDRVEGDFKTGLGLVTLLRRSFLKVLSRVLAGLSHALFGFLAYIEIQAFADTATDEYLERHCGIWGVPRKDATFAEFLVDVIGTAGITITAGTIFRRADGAEYSVVSDYSLTGTADQLHLVSSIAGVNQQVQVGDGLSILSPIAGFTSAVTVNSIIIEPADVELEDSWRARLLDKIRNPPSGGNANDYLQWARAVPGVTRAWVGPQALGPGTVVVYIVNDLTSPITPSGPKITEVASYIETLRPVTANVSVVAPALLPLNMTIKLKPNTTAVQAAVTAELQDLITRVASLAGSYQAPGVLNDGKVLLSQINEAISIALGEQDHLITVINGSSTPGDITPATGQLIVLGVITWQILA